MDPIYKILEGFRSLSEAPAVDFSETQTIEVNQEIGLGDSPMEDRDYVTVSTIEIDAPEEGDDYGTYIYVNHDGPWTIYGDKEFAGAISQILGQRVDFTEQGMQRNGVASMEPY